MILDDQSDLYSLPPDSQSKVAEEGDFVNPYPITFPVRKISVPTKLVPKEKRNEEKAGEYRCCGICSAALSHLEGVFVTCMSALMSLVQVYYTWSVPDLLIIRPSLCHNPCLFIIKPSLYHHPDMLIIKPSLYHHPDMFMIKPSLCHHPDLSIIKPGLYHQPDMLIIKPITLACPLVNLL